MSERILSKVSTVSFGQNDVFQLHFQTLFYSHT